MNKIFKVILIGAGLRGIEYTNIMKELENKYDVVAVAEPIKSRRDYVKQKHNIPDNLCFESYEPLLSLGKIADLAIISTMDKQHFDPAMKAISLKYDLLLEKPVSNNPEECLKIAEYAEKMKVKVLVCHVLRYSDMFVKIKELLLNDAIGDIVSINHEECVGNIHQSHSFVRGNWGNSSRSSNMLLQKSCHDMDILQWLIDKKCKKVQSFGSLLYFTKNNAPKNSPEYCIEGCPEKDCPYNAVKLYLDDKENDWFRTAATKQTNPTDQMIESALRNTQYGKCVYKCDNDVVDHQTVNLLFEDGITATFTMNAFNKGGRFIHIMGTKGELHAAIDGETPISLYDFKTKKTKEYNVISSDGINAGHGGGDRGLIVTLYDYLGDNYKGYLASGITTSVDNHLIVFAAEESRLTSTVIDMDEYVARYKKES